MADVGVFSRYKGYNDYQEEAQKNNLANALAQAQIVKAQALEANALHGGNLPAPLQLANEYQRRLDAGDTAGANYIMQFAKTADKGLGIGTDGSYGQLPGYAPAVAGIEGAKAGAKQDAQNSSDLVYKPQIKASEKVAETNTGKGMQGNDALSIISDIEAADESGRTLLDKGTGSIIGAGIASGKKIYGGSDESTQSNAQLKVLGNRLILNVPRMEGPQSDKDAALYRAAAGQIADPTVPGPDKAAALVQIKKISAKYANPALSPIDVFGTEVPNGNFKQTLTQKAKADFESKNKKRLKYNPATRDFE